MKYNKCFELLKVVLYFLLVISLTWKARVALTLSDFIISVKKRFSPDVSLHRIIKLWEFWIVARNFAVWLISAFFGQCQGMLKQWCKGEWHLRPLGCPLQLAFIFRWPGRRAWYYSWEVWLKAICLLILIKGCTGRIKL